MKRYLRWQGLVGFIVTLSLIACILFIFAGQMIKVGIEQGVAWYTGAEVNVKEVHVTWVPFQVTVQEFQATDAEQPTRNLIAFNKAIAGIDIWQYLFGKVIVDEMTVDGLVFHQIRQQPGAVYQLPNKALDEGGNNALIALPEFDTALPDVKALLANQDLQTIKAGKALEQSYKTEKDKLKKLKAQLPDSEKLKEYEVQLKKLADRKIKNLDDVNQLASDFEQLKKAFKADKAKLSEIKSALAESKNKLAKAAHDLKVAPAQDWQKIESEYQLDKIDAADFAHILFGEQARTYFDTAAVIYEKVKPFLAQSEGNTNTDEQKTNSNGQFIHFEELNPLPNWLVKQGHVNIVTAAGPLTLTFNELTAQHWLRNQASKLQLSASNLMNKGELQANNEFFIQQSGLLKSEGDWRLTALPVKKATLRQSDNLNLALEQAMLASHGEFTLSNNELNGQSSVLISQARYSGNATSSLGNAVIDTVKGMSNLDLLIKVTGKIDAPQFDIDSPLDELLSDAIASQVKAKLNTFKSQFQSGLNKKVANALKINQAEAAEVSHVESLISDSDKTLDSLLNNDIVKQQQKKLEKKLEDKAKNKFKKLFG